jgi:hypothetical protein
MEEYIPSLAFFFVKREYRKIEIRKGRKISTQFRVLKEIKKGVRK